MTNHEIIQIKNFLEGNYLNLKESKTSDAVYLAMLPEYDFQTMFLAVKNYVKKSRFAPTVADLIEEYEALKEIEREQDEKYLLAVVYEMEEQHIFERNINFRTLSEFEKAVNGILDKNLSDSIKTKIFNYAKNDDRVKRILGNNLTKSEDRR